LNSVLKGSTVSRDFPSLIFYGRPRPDPLIHTFKGTVQGDFLPPKFSGIDSF
jgi:hypothetical protein